jgi:DNA-binding NtrC family response regulator
MASSDCSPKPCILIVDDEKSILSFLTEALNCFGYRVLAASSPQEALMFYEERWREIDLVLLDFWLPPMTGTFVFENLQRINPEVRVVLVTGYEESVAETLFEHGLWGYLQKPVSLPDLARKVEEAIRTPSASPPAPLTCKAQTFGGKPSVPRATNGYCQR